MNLFFTKTAYFAKIYIFFHISKFSTNFFLDEALTLAYGVDARMGDFADISEADTLTQQPYFLGILLTHCLV